MLLLDGGNEEAHACEPTFLTTVSLPASFPQFLPSILLGLHGKVRVSGELLSVFALQVEACWRRRRWRGVSRVEITVGFV